MAKIPPLRRIVAEDFPSDVQKWAGKLLQPLNLFLESVTTALNNNLRFGENFDGVVKSLDVSSFPASFKWTRTAKPIGLWIVQCKETSGVHANFTTALFADWQYTQDGQIQILNIPGIVPTAANKYTVTMIAITG